MEFVPLKDWGVINSVPFAIAGPCSAESEEQVLTTCRQIKEKVDVSLFRAGVWKPRTRPGSFEGVGEDGLKWLKAAGKELNTPVTTEVATGAHVELALKHGIDVLWVGARSTTNPFAVQEIADALKGVDVPVIVKNPINPDLALWLGAIERIYNSGINKIAALHRGFSTFDKSKYRNLPMWQIPLQLKSQYPNLPLICDPSHIGGTRDLIYPISQRALDLNYEGLMIETHCNPDVALSDAKQQVTPDRLAVILNDLKIRSKSSTDEGYEEKMQDIRAKLDNIDREIIEVLANRTELVKQIGQLKKDQNVAVFQLDRWKNVFNSRPEWAASMGVNEEFVAQLFKLIHDDSIKVQSEIVDKKEPVV